MGIDNISASMSPRLTIALLAIIALANSALTAAQGPPRLPFLYYHKNLKVYSTIINNWVLERNSLDPRKSILSTDSGAP